MLPGNLAAAGVPEEAARAVEQQAELIGQGVAPVSPDMPAGLAQAITDGSVASFMEGLHAAMYVGIGLALVSAALALLVGRGHGAGDGAAVHV